MKIGDSEFRNIFFLIFPDEAHFLRDRAPGESGVLGLPEIQMLGAVRWDAEGNFEFGFPSAEPPAAEPNVAFDDLRLMVRVEYEKRELLFQLDTGDVESVLYVGFRNEFPDPVKHSGKMAKRTRGGGGELDYDVIVLPKIELRAGGLDSVLRPADIDLKEDLGYGYHGLLGLDLLNQAKVVTLDFRTMSLTLRNGQ